MWNLSPALLGRWLRQVLAKAAPSSADRAELKRVEQKRDMLKNRD
jgi:transposase